MDLPRFRLGMSDYRLVAVIVLCFLFHPGSARGAEGLTSAETLAPPGS